MKKHTFLLILLALVIGCNSVPTLSAFARPFADAQGDKVAQSSQPKTGTYQKISAEEAKARMDSGDPVTVVDVRTESEFNSGHIKNAILIPVDTIGGTRPEQLPDLDAEILVYCRSGIRSRSAAQKLIQLGYTNVYDFGGIMSWTYGVEK